MLCSWVSEPFAFARIRVRLTWGAGNDHVYAIREVAADCGARGNTVLQFIECRFMTDQNTTTVTDSVIQIYTPLKAVTKEHNPNLPVEIIPIVISRITGTFSHIIMRAS